MIHHDDVRCLLSNARTAGVSACQRCNLGNTRICRGLRQAAVPQGPRRARPKRRAMRDAARRLLPTARFARPDGRTLADDAAPGRLETPRRVVAVLAVVVAVAYLVWRIGFTLNPEQPIASGVLLIADFLAVIATVGFALSLWKLQPPPQPGPIPHDLTVDVWIPTYNEDLNILRRTIYHCVNMDHPHTTWVLDDGHRPAVRELAESLGARYLSRPDNTHGKAGNLNHAYRHTSGDLIVSFDADFVPQQDFLTNLLGYFSDSKVALVQVPQRYYNADSFQHRIGRLHGGLWDEQGTFFDLIMTGRNAWNAAYWIGTNAILRRESIADVGGFSTDSIVEDMLTGIRLHAGGWRSIYVNKPLAFGLAPAYLSQFLVQRLRWAQGAAQVLRRQNPLTTRGLSLAQRICYFSSVMHFFEGFAKLVYYLTPALFVLLGMMPIQADENVIAIITGYITFQIIAAQIISRGRVRFFRDELFSMIRFFTYFLGNLALLTRRPLKFRVTPKGDDSGITLLQLIGPGLVLGVNLSAILAGVIHLSSHGWTHWTVLYLTGLVWCTFFAVIAVGALYACLSRPGTVGFAIHDFVLLDVVGKTAMASSHEACITKAWGDERVIFWSRIPYAQGANLDLDLRIADEENKLSGRVVSSKVLLSQGVDRVFEQEVVLDEPVTEQSRLRLIDHEFRIALLRQRERFEEPQSVNFFPLLLALEGGTELGVGTMCNSDQVLFRCRAEFQVGARLAVTAPGDQKREVVVEHRTMIDGEEFVIGRLNGPVTLPRAYEVAPLGRPRRVVKLDWLVATMTLLLTGVGGWVAAQVLTSDEMLAPDARAGEPESVPVTPPSSVFASASTRAPTPVPPPPSKLVLPASAGLSPSRAKQVAAVLEDAWWHVLHHQVITGAGPGVVVAPEPLVGSRGEAYAFFDTDDLDHDGRDGISWGEEPWKAGQDPFELVVVSESQSYRMLQAVLLGDRASFDALWHFTQTRLQHAGITQVAVAEAGAPNRLQMVAPSSAGLASDHLFAWRWHPTVLTTATGWQYDGVIVDRERPANDGWQSATDADADIALALIWAERVFGSVPYDASRRYLEQARLILADLWDRATFEADGRRYLAGWPGGRCVAPGYLAPASYRIFAQVDPEHDWLALTASTYDLIARLPGLASLPAGGAAARPRPNLPPTWVAIRPDGGLSLCPDKPDAGISGSDAFRLLFRVALDARLFDAEQARSYLRAGSAAGPHDFLRAWLDGRSTAVIDGYSVAGKIPSAFTLDGRPLSDEPVYGGAGGSAHRANSGQYGAYLAFFTEAGDPEARDKVLAPLLGQESDPLPSEGYATNHVFRVAADGDGWLRADGSGCYWTVFDHSDWDSQYDYYSNTWAWFGLAYYGGLFDAFRDI